MNTDDYLKEDGVGLAMLIAKGAVSALEVAEAAIGQIERLNPSINAVIVKNYASAFVAAQAKASPLGGVPFLLKDVNLYSHDMPTTFGSRFFRASEPRPDSLLVERWREAGLVILGKTNTPEFAAEFVTEPNAYGPTRNPANLNVTVGGSSGGAAAAVASGMVPLAHATDLGGSIRIPASCCGVFGFKPTSGLNPTGPYFSEIASGLNSDHVVTRSVRDSAASLDITADSRPSSGSYLRALSLPLEPLRIGVTVRDPFGRLSGPAQVAAVEQVTGAFADAGHTIVDYSYPSDLNSGDWFDILWIHDIADLVKERTNAIGRPPRTDELEPLTWQLLQKAREGGAHGRSAAELARSAYTHRYLASFEDIDVLLTPSLAEDPAPIGRLSFASFGDVDRWNEAGYRFAPFSTPGNISGQPAASCPVSRTETGLPVGVQLAARPGQDELILRLAAQLEALLGWR